MSISGRRRLILAPVTVVVLMALVVGDWWQQRREYRELVDRTSHAQGVVDGFLNLGVGSNEEAALMERTLPAEFAKVEQVSILPWHRDLRAARTASVELGAAWTVVATQTLRPDRFAEGYDAGADTVPKFGTMRDRLVAAAPAFTEPYWGTIFP